ncbi:MAG: Uncharacterized protein XD92_1110 [Proteiniphilum acetatigenes]|uniref:DUF4855 domain-containing protein n=1 Tax=Proteiniphilum acetatigenes TaxID=294710 RepID=A0A117LZW1_9BACT|nr:MAG: Uncharacterized protein XD92_1110 [Proteiniphilum acetatigenes]
MKIVNKLCLILLFLSIFSLINCGEKNDGQEKPVIEEGKDEKETHYSWEKSRTSLIECNDMVLLYSGGAHRTYQWSEDYVEPYVTYKDESGQEKWLFDSFLFLEIYNGNKTFATGYRDVPANQQDWRLLVDHYFQSRYCVGALKRSIDNASERIGKPSTKRKIVIGIPEPVTNQKDWGSVRNGEALDFSKSEDRIAACKWYIDYVRAKFNEMNCDNIELAGFYWIAENATTTRTIVGEVSKYLNSMHYSFNWIPYFKAPGYLEWKDLHFNYAYLQPNYFFNESVPKSRLDEACQLAIKYEMDMEVEFDERALVLSRNNWGYRLVDYLEAFKKHGIWSDKRIAYYQGGTTLYELAKSPEAKDRELYHYFCKFVSERSPQ